MFVLILILDGVDGCKNLQQVFQAFTVRLERIMVFFTDGPIHVDIHVEVVGQYSPDFRQRSVSDVQVAGYPRVHIFSAFRDGHVAGFPIIVGHFTRFQISAFFGRILKQFHRAFFQTDRNAVGLFLGYY